MTLYFVPFAASLLNLTGTKPVAASAAAAMLVLAPSSAVPSAESVVKFFSSFRRFSRYLFLSPSFSSLVLTIGRKRGELRKSFTSASSSSSSSSSSLEPSSVPIVCFLFKPPPLPPTLFFPVFRVVSVVIFFPMALSESHLNSSSAQAASFSFSFSGSILSRSSSSSSSSFVLLVLSSLLKMLLTFVFVVVAIFCLLLLLQ